MAAIHITDIEAAIHHWQAQSPRLDGVALAPAVRALDGCIAAGAPSTQGIEHQGTAWWFNLAAGCVQEKLRENSF